MDFKLEKTLGFFPVSKDGFSVFFSILYNFFILASCLIFYFTFK